MPRKRAVARGFTLLELLVVVLLIGLLASMAVLGIQGRTPLAEQREEAERLLARMDLAREEAVLRAQSLGIRFRPAGYHFLVLRDGTWERVRADRTFAPHDLPEGMRIEVDLDGLEVSLADTDEADREAAGGDRDGDAESPPRPQLFFLPGGEIVPQFRVALTAEATDTEFELTPGDDTWLSLEERRF